MYDTGYLLAPQARGVPITSDRIARLRTFGLSEYAARSYLALLDLGVTEARDVSALSKVPASKIYHILDQLHEKGLVLILPEFPRKYAPVPFGDYLQKIHDEHEAAAGAIRREREDLVRIFSIVGGAASGDRGSVTLLRGRRNGLERLEELLGSVEREVLVVASPGMAANPRGWIGWVRAAAQRGVDVRVLAPADSAAGLAAELPASADVRAARGEGLPGAIVVADARRVLVSHFLPDDGHQTEGNDTSLHTDQEGIVALLGALVEAPWREAAPAREARPVPVAASDPAASPASPPA